MTTVTIVGGGQGGATVAQQLRLGGFEGRITLLSADSELPYERPPLSKSVLTADVDMVPVLPHETYADQDIDVRLGETVDRIGDDLTVVTQRSQFASDRVVLSTGSSARRLDCPGSDLPGVLTLHSLQDAREISRRISRDSRVVVIGGGLIGSEISAVLATLGASVTIVDVVVSPMATKVGRVVAHRIEEAQRRAGIVFHHSGVRQIEGTEHVEGVVCDDGSTLPADIVIMGLGAIPALQVARDSGLDIDNGVLVDSQGRTSRPGIFAVGDIAAWPYEHLGVFRSEHYKAAIDQGTAVAAGIVGQGPGRTIVPWFWTEQFTDRVEVVGVPALGDRWVDSDDVPSEAHLEYVLRGDQLVGAVGVNAPRQIRKLGKLIGQGSQFDPAVGAAGQSSRRS